MTSWSIDPFIADLSDSAFERFKRKFRDTIGFILRQYNNPAFSAAVEILLSDKCYADIGREEIAGLIDIMFAEQMKDCRWLARYMNELVTYLPQDDKNKKQYLDRAERYYDLVHTVLPNDVKSLVNNAQAPFDPQLIEFIKDQVNFVLALQNAWLKSDDKSNPISKINTKLAGDESVAALFSLGSKASKGLAFLGLNLSGLFPAHSMQNMDLQLCILLTRIMLFSLNKQSDTGEGSNEHGR